MTDKTMTWGKLKILMQDTPDTYKISFSSILRSTNSVYGLHLISLPSYIEEKEENCEVIIHCDHGGYYE